MVRRSIALLGATGSIGSSTLSVIREQSQYYELKLITAHKDYAKLIGIAREFACKIICLTGIAKLDEKIAIRNLAPELKIYFGEEELLQLLRSEGYDIAVNAITGSAGLQSSFCIVSRGISLALANKESLVMAGHLLMPLSQKNKVPILPVDSEHSAIFQAIGKHPGQEIRKLHITASGGSFRDLPLEQFANITVEQALKHPNWDMGSKVTLDSATMFNKALEVIEAHWLFDLPFDKISAIMHPQSIIHSMVEYIDGSIIAQLSSPDMRLPILYALSYPKRFESNLVETDLLKMGTLSFRELEPARYPLYYLGRLVGEMGGLMPTVMNAANEAALELFLAKSIGFQDIYRIVDQAVQSFDNETNPNLEMIVQTNEQIRNQILAVYAR